MNWTGFIFPRGVIINRDLKQVITPDPREAAKMKEFITHSWYKYRQGDSAGLFPWEGETAFNFTGPKPPFDYLEVEGKYSWLKSPRWNELPMEVGPLARVLILYAKGHEETVGLVNSTLEALKAPLTAVFRLWAGRQREPLRPRS